MVDPHRLADGDHADRGNTVSALVHMYSLGYMAHDDNFTHDEHYKARFFAYLSFFTFAMLMLVTADNLLQMFFGWEGVGVASYLIGFYYKEAVGGRCDEGLHRQPCRRLRLSLGIFGLSG